MMSSGDTIETIPQPGGQPAVPRAASSSALRPAKAHRPLTDYSGMTRFKEGWVEKRSVSAPIMKNWRRRYLIVWDDRVCWYREAPPENKALAEPAGELPLGAGTVIRREPSKPGLISVTSAGRVLMVRGTDEEMVAWNDAISRRAFQSSNGAQSQADIGSGTKTPRGRKKSVEKAASSLDLAMPRPGTTPRPGGAVPQGADGAIEGRADSWQSCCLSTPRDAPAEDDGFQDVSLR